MNYEFNSRRAVDQLKLGLRVTKAQRDRERHALRFMIPAFQWDDNAKFLRQGGTMNGAATPPRPMLTVSKIDQPITLVQNAFQNSHFGINVHPISPTTSNKETAEVFQGIIRKYERDSNAQLMRSFAFDRGVQAGWGVYRIVQVLDEESDNEFDQKPLLKRILNQEAVVFDPSANEPDYSDARWAFVLSYMPIDEFKAEYSKAKLSNASDDVLSTVFRDHPEWVEDDGGKKAVLVAEYFCKHEVKEVKTESDPDGKVKTISKVKTVLMWHKVCAGTNDELEALEGQEWNGQYIPLIPVIGKEMQMCDKERRYMGIVEGSMDSQKGFNYAITNAIEIAALEPKTPVVGVTGQFENHEGKWDTLNTRNWSYVEYNAVDVDGKPAPPPQRMQIDASRLNVSMMLMDRFDAALQATTFTPNAALGKRDRDESGKAIEALQNQSQASTSNYMTNMAQISMTYEGKVLVDMISRLYDRPGRITHMVDFQDESKEVVLNAPFVKGPDGRPQAIDVPQGQPIPEQAKVFDLTKGKYGVDITVGKSYNSLMEQGKETLMAFLEAAPDLAPTLMPVALKYMDEPWADEARKVLQRQNPAFAQGEEGEETPEQLKAQLDQAKQQMQEMQGVIQEMGKVIETDKVKSDAALQKAQMDNQAKLEQTSMDAQSKTTIEEMTSRLQIMLEEIQTEREQMKEQAETERLLIEQRFEAIQAELQREHESKLAVHQAAEAEAMARTAQAHESEESDRGREHESEQSERSMEHESKQAKEAK